MYDNKMIVVVKINGKILREINNTVYIPFGSEYSLSFKNLESRKASVKIFIDGVSVLENNSLIIYPNEESSLERFITDSDMFRGNRFKFIKKTKEISDYRGDKIDDSLIRIEFQFEKEKPVIDTKWIIWDIPFPRYKGFPLYGPMCGSTIGKHDNPDVYRSICENHTDSCNYVNSSGIDVSAVDFVTSKSSEIYDTAEPSLSCKSVAEQGITVKGSISNQGFQYGSIGELEDKLHTIVLKLQGITDNKIKIDKQ